MPLNPEEVVNKRFSATKFRQGYDEEEVDEFLDEVVAELRRLNAENGELRQKLSACESRVAELTRQGVQTQAAPAAAKPAPEPEPTPAPVAVAAPAPAPAPAQTMSGPESAAGMLALAQKLHDEHVEAGKTERNKIISEAQAHAARLVREAEQKQRETLGNLEQQRQVLQTKVEQLKSFEREYRSRLKAYLENQLRELESNAATPAAQSSASASSAPVPQIQSETSRPTDTGATPLPSRGGFGAGEGHTEGDSEPPHAAPRFPFGG
jgi:DivIVA domain-containing protein